MGQPPPDRPRFRLTLEAVGDGPPAAVRLKRFLKAAWRGYQLRCVSVEDMAAPEQQDAADAGLGAAEGEAAHSRVGRT
jgi:hypothetical protein